MVISENPSSSLWTKIQPYHSGRLSTTLRSFPLWLGFAWETWSNWISFWKVDGGTDNCQDASLLIIGPKVMPDFLHLWREVRSPDDNAWDCYWLSEPILLIEMSPQALKEMEEVEFKLFLHFYSIQICLFKNGRSLPHR